MLQNKNIVIIGGTSGLGLSAAKAFCRLGAKVVAVGRDPETGQQAQQELGASALVFTGDAIQENTAAQAIALCLKEFGRLDGLYHVAGGSGRRMGDGPLHEITLEGWQKTLDLNLTSVMLSNQAAIRVFREAKQGGTILNMGSVLGYSPAPTYFATHTYATAKAAIIGFSKSIASYYAPDNIRINVIAPALVETPMAQRAAQDASIQDYIRTKQPLDGGRIGRPEDLDHAAAFLCPMVLALLPGKY
ncbi:3-oxoacyl-[acyl-carrier-protein] reductase [Adhaeribacter pallidiroseus]|uniref:3-oxoacyl-[acyl-carrier-protein] reductase n=1 Tax=Adhaeribacter pallidiroseus TaxID=2072847 RepID=A0A369Q9N8_9BACT|nr:3-oxoacyl-[acyl-carrier-protein] reductase [Adhaeribacter pallidiroseus]